MDDLTNALAMMRAFVVNPGESTVCALTVKEAEAVVKEIDFLRSCVGAVSSGRSASEIYRDLPRRTSVTDAEGA